MDPVRTSRGHEELPLPLRRSADAPRPGLVHLLRGEFLTGAGAVVAATAAAPSLATTTLAVVAPFSGPSQGLGQRLADGVRGAIDEANRLRGPLDRVYALRVFDDRNAAQNAIVNAQFAVGDPSVIATVGHLSSASTLAAIPSYATAQMPLIVPVSTDDRITQTNYRNVFRLATKDSAEGGLFARYAAQRYRPKTAFVLVQDADYGADVASGFMRTMQSRKIAAPYKQFPYDRPDFAAVAAEVAAAKPDHVFLAGTVGDMGPIVPALRAAGYRGPLGASQGFFDGGVSRLGAAANDLVISTSIPYLADAPTVQRERSEFEARYGAMDPLALFGYAAAQVAISAIRRAGAVARGPLITTIATGGPIATLAGSFTFDASGDPLDPELYFYTLRDGALSYLQQAHPSPFMLK